MRIFGLGLILMIVFAILGIDVGESLRTGTITDGDAYAKGRHRKHHERRHHHTRRHTAPATEM